MKFLTVAIVLLLLLSTTTAIQSELDHFQVTEERVYYPPVPGPLPERVHNYTEYTGREAGRRMRDTMFSSRELPVRTMTMLATAYTHTAVPGVPDINGTGDGLTATMTPVREGVVSVDPEVIPLGSWLYVESDYPGITGWYHAEDVGSAIKKDRLDIFVASRKRALNFGRREVRVTMGR